MWKDKVDNDRGVNKEMIGKYLTWKEIPIYLICYWGVALGPEVEQLSCNPKVASPIPSSS